MEVKEKTEVKRRTEVSIGIDYMSNLSYDYFIEDTESVASEIDFFCEVSNSNFNNIIEKYNSNQDDYKNTFTISAIGYSQGDWQDYIIQTNEEEFSDKINELRRLLERSFTHQNDYYANKYDTIIIDGEEFQGDAYDHTTFAINHTEFPDKEEVFNEYIAIYGNDADKITINIDG